MIGIISHSVSSCKEHRRWQLRRQVHKPATPFEQQPPTAACYSSSATNNLLSAIRNSSQSFRPRGNRYSRNIRFVRLAASISTAVQGD